MPDAHTINMIIEEGEGLTVLLPASVRIWLPLQT
jgi:hypothetical protein